MFVYGYIWGHLSIVDNASIYREHHFDDPLLLFQYTINLRQVDTVKWENLAKINFHLFIKPIQKFSLI